MQDGTNIGLWRTFVGECGERKRRWQPPRMEGLRPGPLISSQHTGSTGDDFVRMRYLTLLVIVPWTSEQTSITKESIKTKGCVGQRPNAFLFF
jgi:hypothetical protein